MFRLKRKFILTIITAFVMATFLVFIFPTGCSSGEDAIKKAGEAVTARDYDSAANYARRARRSPEKEKANIILSYIKYKDNMLHAAFWEDNIEALEYLAGIIYDIDAVEDRFNAPVLI